MCYYKLHPINITSAATTSIRFLTWPSVARHAVFVRVDAALAGALFVALQNVVALVRGTEVSFF